MTQKPVQQEGTLVDAFQEDHARLGRALHRLGECLRAEDVVGARTAARELDEIAGPHIAFEESEFYPRLIVQLGSEEVERLRAEHRDGLRLVGRLLETAPPLETREIHQLLERCEAMEVHIAECGALFGALTALSMTEQESLLQRLRAWRERAPRWTQFAVGDEE